MCSLTSFWQLFCNAYVDQIKIKYIHGETDTASKDTRKLQEERGTEVPERASF